MTTFANLRTVVLSIGLATGGLLGPTTPCQGAVVPSSGLVMRYEGANYNQGTVTWTNTGSAGTSANAVFSIGTPVWVASDAALNNQPSVQFANAQRLVASYIGDNGIDNGPFTGTIAEVLIYNRLLLCYSASLA